VQATLAIHIVAGALGLLFGYVALGAAKGATLHRTTGRFFVYAMLTMSVCGVVIAVGRGTAPALNVPAALLSAYLVVTGLTTVRPIARRPRALLVAGMLVAFAVGSTALAFGMEAIANGGTRDGMPAFPFLMFAAVGLLGAGGDLRVLRAGEPHGVGRLARHLWRMCFALFIAALSFFIGQADVIPEPWRIRPLLALPVLTVLVVMVYWLWRVRVRRNPPGKGSRPEGRSRRGIARPSSA
jgi:uncharacterized membrane protein